MFVGRAGKVEIEHYWGQVLVCRVWGPRVYEWTSYVRNSVKRAPKKRVEGRSDYFGGAGPRFGTELDWELSGVLELQYLLFQATALTFELIYAHHQGILILFSRMIDTAIETLNGSSVVRSAGWFMIAGVRNNCTALSFV